MTERLTKIKYNGIVSKRMEETGMSCSTYCDFCSQGGGNCKYVGEMVRKLVEYEAAEEEGRLVVLPCKVGTRVYEIYQFCEYGAWEIEEHKIKLEDLDKIGKTVFLTKEEAEKALKEMQAIQWDEKEGERGLCSDLQG